MNPVIIDLPKRISQLVLRQSEAITELLKIQAAIRGPATTEQDLFDAQQKVVEIAKLIAAALEPA
jgi:hypothetical protein